MFRRDHKKRAQSQKRGNESTKNDTKIGITQVLIEEQQKIFHQQLVLIRDFRKYGANLLIVVYQPNYLEKSIFGQKYGGFY